MRVDVCGSGKRRVKMHFTYLLDKNNVWKSVIIKLGIKNSICRKEKSRTIKQDDNPDIVKVRPDITEKLNWIRAFV